jgi:hypothetical protein
MWQMCVAATDELIDRELSFDWIPVGRNMNEQKSATVGLVMCHTVREL